MLQHGPPCCCNTAVQHNVVQRGTTRRNRACCGAAAAGAKGVADVLRRLRRLKALHVGGNALGGSDGLQFSGALQQSRAVSCNTHRPLQHKAAGAGPLQRIRRYGAQA